MRSLTIAALSGLLVLPASVSLGRDWTNWRGPAYNGSAETAGLPVRWSASENVAWKADLPGPSAATPIVVKGRVFLCSLDGASGKLLAMGLDRVTGKVLWRHETGAGQLAGPRGMENSLAECSPVTDGEVVCFLFGTGALHGYDLDGRQLWQRDLVADHGPLEIQWRYASSPLLYEGTLYVQVLRSGESYLLALDPKTGETRWRHVREDPSSRESEQAYTTPLPFDNGGRSEIVVVGADCVTGHDAATGEERWRWCGLNPRDRPNYRIIASAVAGEDGFLYVPAPRGSHMHGLRVHGDKVEEVWSFKRPAPDVATPLLYRGRLYVIDGAGRRKIACVDPKSGEFHWEGELETETFIRSSPTGADGKLYIMDAEGQVLVLEAGDEQKVLAKIDMDSYPCRACIVADDGQLLVRTAEALYCVGAKRQAGASDGEGAKGGSR